MVFKTRILKSNINNHKNISEQNCLDKTVFNNVNRLDHSSPISNTVTSKIKYFPQLLALGPQIPLKIKWHHIPP